MKLSTTDWTKLTPEDLETIYTVIGSDGCTGVSQFYREACIKHDYWYRTHTDFDGSTITREEADRRFRLDIQSMSKFGWFSPMSWWRWAGVRTLGANAWEESFAEYQGEITSGR